MNCTLCGGDMIDRGALGGLYWGQCRNCGAWTHRPPEDSDFADDPVGLYLRAERITGVGPEGEMGEALL